MNRVIIFFLVFLSLACSRDDKNISNIASKDSLLIKGYLGQSSNIWKDEGHTVLTKSIDGVKSMMMITDTLVNNSETGDVTFDPLDLYMYDSSGVQTLNVKSIHGYYKKAELLTIAIREVTLESQSGNQVLYLYTDSLVYMQKSDQVITFPVHLKIFTKSLDTLLYVVKADKGVWNMKTMKSVLTDNVVIEYKKDNVELICEDLLFDSKEDVVISKGHVKFKRVSGDYIEGDGFVSDSKFEHWKIQKNIKGEIFDMNMNMNNL